jgi:16S rRNA (guanine527-N7)-methyltransferase
MPLNASQIKNIKSWFEIRDLPLNPDFLIRIGMYQNLILSWSKRINLISKGDHAQIIENHILDSLGPIELIPKTGKLIDIGTGAGLPGIPIALVRPRLEVTLMESIHKKILFLRAVKSELKLDKVEIVECRLEDYSPTEPFDVATMRALPRWESHLEKVMGMVRPGGKIIYYQKRGIYTTAIV